MPNYGGHAVPTTWALPPRPLQPNYGGHEPNYGGHELNYGGHELNATSMPNYGGHEPNYGGHELNATSMPNYGGHELTTWALPPRPLQHVPRASDPSVSLLAWRASSRGAPS